MSKYNGVSTVPNSSKFRAQINRCGRTFYLGNYENADSAAFGYDRAANLTRGWKTGATVLNVNEGPNVTEPPAEEFWTEQEKIMLEYLRNNFPIDEGTARNEAAVKMETPDVLLADAERVEKGRTHQRHLEDALGRDFVQWIKDRAKQIAELKAENAFQKIQIEDLLEQRGQEWAKSVTSSGKHTPPAVIPKSDSGTPDPWAPKRAAEAELMKSCTELMAKDIREQLEEGASSSAPVVGAAYRAAEAGLKAAVEATEAAMPLPTFKLPRGELGPEGPDGAHHPIVVEVSGVPVQGIDAAIAAKRAEVPVKQELNAPANADPFHRA